MKKYSLILLFVTLLLASCFKKKNNISISFEENQNEFEMNANYRKSKTQRVEDYIQSKMQSATVYSNTNNAYNTVLIEDDNAKFYLQSSTGNLHIKLDKNENSEQSYYRVKEMCEEIKEIIAQ